MLLSDARAMNERSQELYDNALTQLEQQREKGASALERLGNLRLDVYDGELRRFATAFERLKNVDFSELGETSSVAHDELEALKLSNIDFGAVDGFKAAVASGGAGALAGMAAYGAAGALATASTGAAISGLGGAAATNATLAWFGGGSLAAGGMGMAGGMVVLGGIVAVPMLLVGGFIFHQHGKKQLEKAKANRAEAKAVVANIESMKLVARAISLRAEQGVTLLKRLRQHFVPMVSWLEEIAPVEGDYADLSTEQQQTLFQATTLAVTVRRVLEVPILDDAGAVNEQARIVFDEANELRKSIDAAKAASA